MSSEYFCRNLLCSFLSSFFFFFRTDVFFLDLFLHTFNSTTQVPRTQFKITSIDTVRKPEKQQQIAI